MRSRNFRLRWTIALVLASVFIGPLRSDAQTRRTITQTDLFSFVWAADPQMSPDGSKVVFVRVNISPDKTRYETTLYLVPSDGSLAPRQLTSGKNDSAPRWAPDGNTIAFVRTPAPADGKPKPAQIFLLSMNGGEARGLTDMPQGASSPRWSPDGRTIAFLSSPPPDSTAGKDTAPNTDTLRKNYKSDVRVITRAQYRWNGGGYSDVESHTHIYTVAATLGGTTPAPKQITSGRFDESAPAWAPDGSKLYFTSDRHFEPYYETVGSELFMVPASGGETQKIASIDGSIGTISVSPDGKQIAFIGNANGKPVRSYDQPDLFVTSATGGTPRNLTANYDYDVGAGITADQHPPRAGGARGITWSRDGKNLFVVSVEHGRSNLKRVGVADGKVDPVTNGDHEVVSYSAAADGLHVVSLISTPVNIGDLFVTRLSSPASPPKQITRINEPLFSQIDQSVPEEIWYNSFDGKRIQGWILKPPHFDAKKKYPLILQIHGGPHAAYGSSFTHEFSWMAAKGYVVLYTNPRGSTSYGQDFGNIIQFHYPGDDYKDLMAGVDEVVKRGYIDSARMGVTGGSGGGVLTNWAITQTNRFAAAASQRSIADWAGFWYGADFTLFTPTWFRAAPWEDPKDFAERSAISHIANVKTPLMLIDGDSDLRTPPAYGGEVMFRALKYLKVPTVMIRFPEETHELSRSGRPWHRVERLEHIVGWFDKYLQNNPTSRYDVR